MRTESVSTNVEVQAGTLESVLEDNGEVLSLGPGDSCFITLPWLSGKGWTWNKENTGDSDLWRTEEAGRSI